MQASLFTLSSFLSDGYLVIDTISFGEQTAIILNLTEIKFIVRLFYLGFN